MSVLLIDPDPSVGGAILEHLLDEGDEVRVLSPEAADWRQRGAFLAVGDPLDADLIERACTNVRTVVFTPGLKEVPLSYLATVVPAARRAGADRMVVCVPNKDGSATRWLERSGSSFVVLVTGRRGFLPKKLVDPATIARAVSAADDLAGEPKLIVDLADEREWGKLGGHP